MNYYIIYNYIIRQLIFFTKLFYFHHRMIYHFILLLYRTYRILFSVFSPTDFKRRVQNTEYNNKCSPWAQIVQACPRLGVGLILLVLLSSGQSFPWPCINRHVSLRPSYWSHFRFPYRCPSNDVCSLVARIVNRAYHLFSAY